MTFREPRETGRPAMAPARPPVMDDVTLYAWIAQAVPGEMVVYHRGFLGVDTGPVMSTLPEADRQRLAALGAAAYRAFEMGLVHLVQSRLDVDRFAYIAIARPKPNLAAAALSERLLAAA